MSNYDINKYSATIFYHNDLLGVRKYIFSEMKFEVLELFFSDLVSIRNLKKSKKFDYLESTNSIYIFEGKSNNEIYVGQTGNFFGRMEDPNHEFKKNNMKYSKIYIISSREITKSTLLQLESKIINLLTKSGSDYKVANSNKESKENLTEKDETDFPLHLKWIDNILTFFNFNLNPKEEIEGKRENEIFENEKDIKNKTFSFRCGETSGKMQIRDGKVYGLKGSTIKLENRGLNYNDNGAFYRKSKNQITSLKENKIIEESKKDAFIGTLIEDHEFNSSSLFAGLICGRSASGPLSFIDENGIKLKEYIEQLENQKEN